MTGMKEPGILQLQPRSPELAHLWFWEPESRGVGIGNLGFSDGVSGGVDTGLVCRNPAVRAEGPGTQSR
jgi:hypothetical protein